MIEIARLKRKPLEVHDKSLDRLISDALLGSRRLLDSIAAESAIASAVRAYNSDDMDVLLNTERFLKETVWLTKETITEFPELLRYTPDTLANNVRILLDRYGVNKLEIVQHPEVLLIGLWEDSSTTEQERELMARRIGDAIGRKVTITNCRKA